ncbi:tetratricopeptide repeat protein, partial [Brasilonema sp. CT11]|nr:tetratricopeptide repeat protein [Brasilonema sp. CT11]
MNTDLNDWDEDLPPEPEEAYQDLVRALKRKSGFGLFFVQCTPAESDRFITKLPQDIPHKNVAALRLVEPIDNLYQRVAEFVKDKPVDILLIKGLEYSLYKYEQRTFGEITEGQFSNLTRVPPILNHLNQQRERFRDDFPFCFVFLLRSFSINYLIHRAPDFFDWRSGVFELPTTLEVVEEETSRLLLEGDYQKYLQLNAEQKIEKILEFQELLTEQHQTESRKADLLFELGNLLVAAKEYEAVIASYDQALKFKPDDDLAWNFRGYALDELGRYEEAVASFDQALKFKPDDDSAWYFRGNALRKLGRYEEAVASYDQALKFKPDDYWTWYNRGNALRKLGRYEEAVASFDQALKIKPDKDSVWNFRGNALQNLGRYEEAVASFDQALKFKPDKDSVWNFRGFALEKLGRYEEAIASYDQALKIKPDDYWTWYNRGNALGNLGRYEQALESFDQALKFKPDKDSVWNFRGFALEKLGRYEEAIASYDQALKF